MASGCENKGGMVRRVNMSKARVVPLVPPLLPKPQFGHSVVTKRPLVEERQLPSLVNNKKQRLSDHRCVSRRFYHGCHVHFQGGGGPGGQPQCGQDALTG